MPDQEKIWLDGLRLATRLKEAGHEAYLVGGCVRDRLLARSISDIDIATSALPHEVQALFDKVIPTGLQHGTVTVLSGEIGFEVTTFRQETAYSDARHPDEVLFVKDVKEDLARRDFTINAIAFGTDGTLIDPYGGQDDLRRGLVRCVGDANERFGEDALRMLRGIRFAAEFGFGIDEATWEAILSQREQLKHIAMERVGVELDKMIAGSHPSRAIDLLRTSGLLGYAKDPLLSMLPHAGMVSFVSEEDPEGAWRKVDKVEARWAAFLLHGSANERQAAEWMRKLKFSSKRAASVSTIVAISDFLRENIRELEGALADRERWTQAVLKYGVEAASDYLAIARAFPSIDRSLWGDTGLADAERWSREIPVRAVKDLTIRGDELARLSGRVAGPWIAEELGRLLLLVALNKLGNDPKNLQTEFLRHMSDSQSE